MAAENNESKVYDSAKLREHRKIVIGRAKRAYKELTTSDKDTMKALFELRYERIGYSPLQDHGLTIAEQMNQTFHALAVFAGAEFIFNEFRDCGKLRLSPLTASGLDIQSIYTNLVAAEVFTTVNPKYNGKLDGDAKELCNKPFRNRFVFFYSPCTDRGLIPYSVPGFSGIELKVYSLCEDELLGRKPINIPRSG